MRREPAPDPHRRQSLPSNRCHRLCLQIGRLLAGYIDCKTLLGHTEERLTSRFIADLEFKRRRFDVRIDAIARIHFYDIEHRGFPFKQSMESVSHFGSLAEIDGELYSCWIIHNFQRIVPGQTVDLPITFLFSELVRPKLRVGLKFALKNDASSNAAECHVLEVIDERPTVQ